MALFGDHNNFDIGIIYYKYAYDSKGGRGDGGGGDQGKDRY